MFTKECRQMQAIWIALDDWLWLTPMVIWGDTGRAAGNADHGDAVHGDADHGDADHGDADGGGCGGTDPSAGACRRGALGGPWRPVGAVVGGVVVLPGKPLRGPFRSPLPGIELATGKFKSREVP